VKSGELYRRQLLRLAELGCVSGLISAYHFEKDGTLQSLIHHLKYSGMTTVGIVLGRRLGGMSMKEMTGVAVSGIIPVPLHRIKERERGYNQSVFLAKGLSEVTGFPVLTEVLVRHKHTVSQTQLTMEKRLANVSDAFSLRSGMSDTVKGKRFIILDDVLTTGATIGSCAKALVGGGAVSVVACTVALAE
jgi:ComF family protein